MRYRLTEDVTTHHEPRGKPGRAMAQERFRVSRLESRVPSLRLETRNSELETFDGTGQLLERQGVPLGAAD
jgi:hypothetical protein